VATAVGADVGVRLLLAVARLGEADLSGWWNSRGCSEAGQYVLGGAFPRTWPVTALQLAVVSAAIRHDDELKRPSAVHLFSDQLPFKRLAIHWLGEQKLARQPDPLVKALAAWTKDRACRELAEWAGGPPKGELVGPGRRLGALSQKEIGQPDQLERVARALAGCYPGESNVVRLPYYDMTS
jgi:hypothetical protein